MSKKNNRDPPKQHPERIFRIDRTTRDRRRPKEDSSDRSSSCKSGARNFEFLDRSNGGRNFREQAASSFMKRAYEEDKHEHNWRYLGRSSRFSYSECDNYSDEEQINFYGQNDFEDNLQNPYFRRERYYSEDELDEFPIEIDYADYDFEDEIGQEAQKEEAAPICCSQKKGFKNEEFMGDLSTIDGLSIFGEDLDLNMQRAYSNDQNRNQPQEETKENNWDDDFSQ